MNVWIKLSRRRVRCKHCNKWIETGEYQVVCQYFIKQRSGKTWTKRLQFHAKQPYCWVDRAVTELEMRPHIETRGRKRDTISDANRTQRQKILCRRAAIMQRINTEFASNSPRPNKLVHMLEALEKLKVEIEPFGGVPKTWEQKE